MSEGTGKTEKTEQKSKADEKRQAELTADDLDQVAGGITATHSTTINETFQKVEGKI